MELLEQIKREINFHEDKKNIQTALSNRIDTSDEVKSIIYISLYLKKKITSENSTILQDKDVLEMVSSLLYFNLFIDNELAELVDNYLRSVKLSADSQLLGYALNLVDVMNENTDFNKLVVDSLFNQFLKAAENEITKIHSLNRLVKCEEEFSEPRHRIDIVSNGLELKKEFKQAERVLKRLNDNDEKEKVKQYIQFRVKHLIKGVFK